MSAALALALPQDRLLVERIAAETAAVVADVEHRRFADGESYVRIATPCPGRDAYVVAALRNPDEKIVPLALLADAARGLGADRVGLVAPYLPYMRQDARFHDGEAVAAATFARMVSAQFDWLVTVDPHLHRIRDLGQVYSIPARAATAAPAIAAWIRANVREAVVVGPDEESGQWVREVAAMAEVPFEVLRKVRWGDRDVSVAPPDVGRLRGRAPVVVDDIVATARTMVAAVRTLASLGIAGAVCVGVHAVFADDAADALSGTGARIVTCDTLPHPTNAIAVSPAIGAAVREFLLQSGDAGRHLPVRR
jgi:ribose-phosphate pyrophosphokinase